MDCSTWEFFLSVRLRALLSAVVAFAPFACGDGREVTLMLKYAKSFGVFGLARVGPIGRVSGRMVWLIVSVAGRLNVRSDLSTQFTHNENMRCNSLCSRYFGVRFYSCCFFSLVLKFFAFFLLLNLFLSSLFSCTGFLFACQLFNFQSSIAFISLSLRHCLVHTAFGVCFLSKPTSSMNTPDWRNEQKTIFFSLNTHKTSKLCQRLASMFSFTFRLSCFFYFCRCGLSSFIYRTNTPNGEFKYVLQTAEQECVFRIVLFFLFFFSLCFLRNQKLFLVLYYICNKAALLMRSTCQNKPGQYLIWFGCYYIHSYYWTYFASFFRSLSI